MYRKDAKRFAAAVTVDGRRVTLYRPTRQKAEQALALLLSAKEKSQPIRTDERQTVAAFLEDWLAALQPAVRPSTYQRYRAYVRHQLIPALGQRRIVSITPLDLQRLYSRLLADGLSATTVNHLHAAIHRAFEQALRWDLIDRNPADRIDPPRKRTAPRPTLDVDQVARLIAKARDQRLGALVVLAATAGLREGELVGLRWDDIDFEHRVIHVNRQMARAEHGYELAAPKTATGRRPVRIAQIAADLLRRRQIEQKEERLAAGPDWHETGLVFTRPNGQRVSPTHVGRDLLGPLLAAAELPRVRLHDLRHTFATLSLRAHIPMKIVQEALGHASLGITADLYSHVAEDMQEPIADAMDALFGQRG